MMNIYTLEQSSIKICKWLGIFSHLQVTKSFWEPLGISNNGTVKNLVIEEFLSGAKGERTYEEKKFLLNITDKIKKSSFAQIASQSCSEMILLLCKFCLLTTECVTDLVKLTLTFCSSLNRVFVWVWVFWELILSHFMVLLGH